MRHLRFAAPLPPGETLASVRAKQVAEAARRTGVSPAAFRRSQDRAARLRAGIEPPPSRARERREITRALARSPRVEPDTFTLPVPLPPDLAHVTAIIEVTRRS